MIKHWQWHWNNRPGCLLTQKLWKTKKWSFCLDITFGWISTIVIIICTMIRILFLYIHKTTFSSPVKTPYKCPYMRGDKYSERSKRHRDWLRSSITGQHSHANKHGNNWSRRHRRSFLQRLVVNWWRRCLVQRRWISGKNLSFKRYSQELPSTPASATQVALVCNALPPILNICFCIVFYRMDPRPLFCVRTTNAILYKYDVI